MRTGRPTKYDPKTLPKVREMCALGATHREVAEFLKIGEATLYAWKHEHAEFSEALKLGKNTADDRVEQSLYRRATGYSFDTVKILANGKKPIVVPHVEHVPPDTTAAIFWLKNRRRHEWRDKQDLEVAGPNGGPILTKVERIVRTVVDPRAPDGEGVPAADEAGPVQGGVRRPR